MIREKGLIAAYDMAKWNGGKLVNIAAPSNANSNNPGLYDCTVNRCVKSKTGLQTINTNTSYLTPSNTILNNTTVWTVSIRFNNYSSASTAYFIGGNTTKNLFLNRSSNIGIRDSAGSYHYFTDLPTVNIMNREIILTIYSDGTGINAFLNGLKSTITITPTTTQLLVTRLLQGYPDNYTPIFNCKELKIYNRTLSDSEIKAYHNSFIKPVILEDFSNYAIGTKDNFGPWVKRSGTFTVDQWANNKIFPFLNGGFDTNTVWTKGTGCTIENGKGVVNNAGSLFVAFSQAITTIRHRRYKITYTISDFVSGALKTYLSGGTSYTQNQYKSADGTYVEYITAEADGSTFYVYAGSGPNVWKIDNISVEVIDPLSDWKETNNILRCTTAGVIGLKSNIAYGTWEFDWMKGLDSGSFIVYFINKSLAVYPNSVESYAVAINSNEAFWLGKLSGGTNTYPTITVNSYLKNYTWYSIRITRTVAGVFTVWIKGDAFTSWTLISVTGGSGANPSTDNAYTSSLYFIVHNNAGDCFTNLKIYPGIIL